MAILNFTERLLLTKQKNGYIMGVAPKPKTRRDF